MNRNQGALPSRTAAEQILWLRRDLPTTPMHVLKLAYLCHGWMLGVFGRGLIAEPAEAWRYGPAVPTVYHTYKSFRGGPITAAPADRSAVLDENQNDLLEAVLRAYRGYSAWDLSAITHQPGTPWHAVYNGGRGEGAIIPDSLLEKHYAERFQEEEGGERRQAGGACAAHAP